MISNDILFLVRVVNGYQQTVTVVCELCGCELPNNSFKLVDAHHAGMVMLEHARVEHGFTGSKRDADELK